MVTLIAIVYGAFIFLMAIISFFILFKIYIGGFSYKVRIRRLTSNNTKVIKDCIGKIKRDKQKIPYLSLYFGLRGFFKKPLPSILPIPAADVTEYDSKSNKLIVEAYYDDSRGYTYIQDPTNIETLNQLKGKNGFRVFPTNDRQMMVNQLYKRDSNKPKSVGEMIIYLTPFIALIMILTIFLIFYGKAVEPVTAASKSTAEDLIEMQKIELQITEKMDNLFRNIVNYERGRPLEQVIIAPEARDSG